jgi:hypothetical protein
MMALIEGWVLVPTFLFGTSIGVLGFMLWQRRPWS